MINLASLSALLRTLRQVGGPDGPAVPVARVPPVASLTPEDTPAGSGTAQVRAWSSSQARNAALLDDELLSMPAARRDGAVARANVPAPGGPAGRPDAGTQAANPPDTTELELTVGGRLLQGVLRASGGTPPMPPAIEAAAPLVASSRAGAVELARGLAQSVGESGLFYESHLARWVRRDYAVTALQREPQASWTATPDGAVPTGEAPPLAANGAPALVTRQLDALDTRAIVWTGELWPGQRASVAFEENDRPTRDDADANDETRAAGWRTRIVLELPSLGRVQATLALSGSMLDLAIEAPSGQARTRLAHAQAALASALAGARAELRRFDVTVAAGR